MRQLQFEKCRFCQQPFAVEDEHHCVGFDRARSQSWSRIYRFLAVLSEWFEIDAAPVLCERQLNCAIDIHDTQISRVWAVRMHCRKCDRMFCACEPPGYGDTAADICDHRDECFRKLALVKRPWGRRQSAVVLEQPRHVTTPSQSPLTPKVKRKSNVRV